MFIYFLRGMMDTNTPVSHGIITRIMCFNLLKRCLVPRSVFHELILYWIITFCPHSQLVTKTFYFLIWSLVKMIYFYCICIIYVYDGIRDMLICSYNLYFHFIFFSFLMFPSDEKNMWDLADGFHSTSAFWVETVERACHRQVASLSIFTENEVSTFRSNWPIQGSDSSIGFHGFQW